MVDSVGLALLVVLDTLAPAARLAFVLHDVFAVPYAEIAPVLERSTAATKMLASRARQRVREAGAIRTPDAPRQRTVVRAFLAASRGGDFAALLALLDPCATFRADSTAVAAAAPAALDGGLAVARQFDGRARAARPAVVDGAFGAVWTRRGRPAGAFVFTLAGDRIGAVELVADPARLAAMELTVLRADGAPATATR